MKKINKIIFAILCMLTYMSIAYAASPSFSGFAQASGQGSSSRPGSSSSNYNPGGIDGLGSTAYTPYSENGKSYRCYYKHSITNNTDLNLNAYDMNGKSLIPNSISASDTLTAGTWIGININETKSVSWSINSFHYYEMKKTFKCYYKVGCTNTLHTRTSKTACKSGETAHINGGVRTCTYWSCDGGYEGWKDQEKKVSMSHTLRTQDCPLYLGTEAKQVAVLEENIKDEVSYVPGCKSKAVSEVKSEARSRVGSASNKLKFNKSDTSESETSLYITGTSVKGLQEKDSGDSGTYWQEFEYIPKTVCMNMLTSKVAYNEDCNVDNSIVKKISNGTVYDEYLKKTVTYWRYFVPLDSKTNSITQISLIKNPDSLPLTEAQCRNGMQANKNNYFDLVQPKKGSFTGDYDTDIKMDLKEGCYISITLRFSNKQRFYGETSNYELLKGYGMYFRQIDPSNPFPTVQNNTKKLDRTSYWYGYDTSKFKTFENITYIANMSKANIDAVRKFNDNNPYTKWTNEKDHNNYKMNGMNSDGSSVFINKYASDIFAGARAKNSKYEKIGCYKGKGVC